VTRLLLGVVALLAIALVVEALVDSSVVAGLAAILFFAVLVTRFELWPGSRERHR
jgi:hypothetical protein